MLAARDHVRFPTDDQIARLIHPACGMTNLKYLFLKMRAQSLKQT